jgi:ADP-ribose pyrophosphatase YjhB (NUDIX family)
VPVTLHDAIDFLDRQVPDPTAGLPEEIFLLASRLTPLVNVDLLIQYGAGRTLLAWRKDQYHVGGWHLPGGILRFKEKLESRIQKVAEGEVGLLVEYDPTPIAVNQLIHPSRNSRGHFISFLYRCSLPADYLAPNEGSEVNHPGFLMWHDDWPENLLRVHEIFKTYLHKI